MKPSVRAPTALALILGVVVVVAAFWAGAARAQTFAPDGANDPRPHPALVLGVGDLVLTGALIPAGLGVGAGVGDNGWEKASTLIGAGLGVGALGVAATVHGVEDGGRRLKDPTAAGFGWLFTSLAAGGFGSGIGLVIGGEKDGKPVGAVIAAASVIFLAPGIPLIADGERSAVEPPAHREWGRSPTQDEGLAIPTPSPDGGWVAIQQTAPPATRLNSPAMVGFGTAFLVVGGLGSLLGLGGVAIGASVGEESVTALGGGVLASGLGVALFAGLPLVVVGAQEVAAPQLSVGPGGVGLSGSF